MRTPTTADMKAGGRYVRETDPGLAARRAEKYGERTMLDLGRAYYVEDPEGFADTMHHLGRWN